MASCAYLLPLRRAKFCGTEAAAFRDYFEILQEIGCEVIVIDGSPPEVFAEHAAIFLPPTLHIGVDRQFGYLNDKVNAVHTGMAISREEKIILADDDIRYTPETVAQTVNLLDRFEVVRPQNFLRPLPFWARMESARMLINRATLPTGDYPGTCAFRRSTFLRVGHYDGDVLFDNEEIIRHFAEKGATIDYALDLFVQKRASSFRKWLEQRPRQAYEDFGLRTKTALFLSVLPLLLAISLLAGALGFLTYLGMIALISFSIAVLGRSRGRAQEVVPFSSCLFAPLWIAERSLSSYAAVYWYLTRGGYPFGDRVLSKGLGRSWFAGGRVASRQLRRKARA
jgi:peroxiredoxin